MESGDKLPLVKNAMKMLAETLTARDRVAIVTYAGTTGVSLPATRGDRTGAIQDAISALSAGGSTNGGAGIQLAYQIAIDNFVKGGINRVILATDGDFNVGVTSLDALTRLIEEKRGSGVFLSVLGVGTGNLKDATMEKLADKGNGNYSYLDSLTEARKVLVAEAGSTLVTVAKDVKIQVEFNPALVGAYRLVGYENRRLKAREFNDDTKDAGEMGAGHSVTALYEIVPPGEDVTGTGIDALKYQRPAASPAATVTVPSSELMTVRSAGRRRRARSSPCRLGRQRRREARRLRCRRCRVRHAAARSRSTDATWADAVKLATVNRGEDRDGYRADSCAWWARGVARPAAFDRLDVAPLIAGHHSTYLINSRCVGERGEHCDEPAGGASSEAASERRCRRRPGEDHLSGRCDGSPDVPEPHANRVLGTDQPNNGPAEPQAPSTKARASARCCRSSTRPAAGCDTKRDGSIHG
jgi:Ca-activated chloride channel family protein